MTSLFRHTIASFFLCLLTQSAFAQDDDLGDVIQINTRLHSFVGKPSWLLVIRDLDHNKTIPYLYDFNASTNNWVALTYGIHYLITTSTLQFTVYNPAHNTYRTHYIHDFCGLESHGHIERDVGMSVWLDGDLWFNEDDGYHCNVNRYPNAGFTVVQDAD